MIEHFKTDSYRIFEALRRTMGERIDQSDWLTPYSKVRAREKVDAMECHLGILDWSKYEADMPVSDDICSALHEVGSSHITKMMRNSGENQNLDHIIANSYMMPYIGTSAYDSNFMYLRNCNATLILPSTSILTDMSTTLMTGTNSLMSLLKIGFICPLSAGYAFGKWILSYYLRIYASFRFKKSMIALYGRVGALSSL